MASIHREILISADPATVGGALRDVGAVHTRLARGFVADTKLEPGARVVTFANDQSRAAVHPVAAPNVTHLKFARKART